MRIQLLALAALLTLALPASSANVTGTWQADDKMRHVLKIERYGKGYRGNLHHLGDEASGKFRNNSITAIVVSGSNVRFSLDKAEGAFDGAVSNDGKTLSGTLKTLFGPPLHVTFDHAVKGAEWIVDPSPHKTVFVTVQPGVKLEVLDWGGKGAPLILLAGLGGTGHSFDGFAEKLTGNHHVYAITRRGFGDSSFPSATDANYDADRLGDDVLAAMVVLKIEKPVLAGHSIAGGELSSIGTRHPEKIAALIYLESLYQYAFYNPAQADLALSSAIVRRNLDRMFDLQPSPSKWSALIKDTQVSLTNLQQALKETAETLDGPDLPLDGQAPSDLAGNKIIANARAYTAAPVPVLAILALPRRCAPNCDKPFMQKIMAADAARADLFEKSAPNAKVVRIGNASHYIYRSNEADVLREMNSFMDGLSH
jgi:pimeloyl-ACP methyl ester carboxylesterase